MQDNYKPWHKRVAQVGLISKAGVYIIFGILILMATYTTGDPIGLMELVKYFINQGTLGRFLVVMMSIGLFCYAAWKFFQMVLNLENYDKDLYGYFVRITWLGPFIFHVVLGTHGLVQFFKWQNGQFFYYHNEESELQRFLYTETGKWLIGLMALMFLVNAITLFYLAFTGKYTIMLTGRNFYERSPRLARITGLTGYISYGISLLITGGLFAYSIYKTSDPYLEGQESMFHYLLARSQGQLLLTFIAFGTVCYGLYFALTAYYRWRSGESG